MTKRTTQPAQTISALKRSAPIATQAGRTHFWLASAIIFVSVVLTFWPALQHDFVDWDDTDNFIRNTGFRGLQWTNLAWMFSTFHMGHFQPLTWLSLAIDYTWGAAVFGEHPEYGRGMDPRAYHTTNVALHAINAVLVFMLAVRLIRRSLRTSVPGWAVVIGAGSAALLFGLHPLRVESVAWATERRDLLSGLFLLLAVLAYLKANELGRANHTRWMVITFALFTCSLLSKVMGVTLPVVLLILDWYPLRRLDPRPSRWLDSDNLRVIAEKAPFFAWAVIFGLVASIGQKQNQWLVTLDMHGIPQRIVQSFYGLCFYISKSVAPVRLSPLYQLDLPMNVTEPRFVISIIAVIVAGASIAALSRRCPALLAVSLVYAIMLLPVLGLMQNGPQLVADRYSYLPVIGVTILAGGGVCHLVSTAWPSTRVLTGLGMIAACVVLAILTWRQTLVWRNTTSLWTHAYACDPSSGFAQNGYGFVLLEQNQLDEAERILRQAIRTQPQNQKAHFNLWRALRLRGDEHALEAAYQSALAVESMRAPAAFELGNLCLKRASLLQAQAHYEACLRAKPDHLEARTNLGFVLARLGQREQAIEQYRRVLEFDPDFFQARYNLGLSLDAAGRRNEAIEQLQIARRLKPDHEGVHTALTRLLQAPSTP